MSKQNWGHQFSDSAFTASQKNKIKIQTQLLAAIVV